MRPNDRETALYYFAILKNEVSRKMILRFAKRYRTETRKLGVGRADLLLDSRIRHATMVGQVEMERLAPEHVGKADCNLVEFRMVAFVKHLAPIYDPLLVLKAYDAEVLNARDYLRQTSAA